MDDDEADSAAAAHSHGAASRSRLCSPHVGFSRDAVAVYALFNSRFRREDEATWFIDEMMKRDDDDIDIFVERQPLLTTRRSRHLPTTSVGRTTVAAAVRVAFRHYQSAAYGSDGRAEGDIAGDGWLG